MEAEEFVDNILALKPNQAELAKHSYPKDYIKNHVPPSYDISRKNNLPIGDPLISLVNNWDLSAGSPQNIQLPVDQVTLSGSATDNDGSVSSFSWSKHSGPETYTISSPGTVTTDVTGLVAGTYVFRLVATDNQGATAFNDVTITVSGVNVPPVANSGSAQNIQLPLDNVTLSGTATDSDGSIASYSWTKQSGPETYTISSPSSASTQVTGLIAGTYVFRLLVTDNQGPTAFSDVTITVSAAVSPNPVANAGPNKFIQLPASSVTLTGTGTDADGTVTSYNWTQASGPTVK